MTAATEEEVIGGYRVHPAASVFPMIEGDEFDDLCESIRNHGVQHAAVVRGDELIDGRNRMRAVERLRADGWSGNCPVTEWVDDGRNVAEWIWETNAIRRHMTEDGLVYASAAIWPLIAKENEARREASKFDKAKATEAAKARHAVTTKSSSPLHRLDSTARCLAVAVPAATAASITAASWRRRSSISASIRRRAASAAPPQTFGSR